MSSKYCVVVQAPSQLVGLQLKDLSLEAELSTELRSLLEHAAVKALLAANRDHSRCPFGCVP